MTYRIGIIGGGVIGLSVGNIIQERYPSALIEIVANNFFENTTSWGAAGVVRFHANENKVEDALRWNEKGINHYMEMFRSKDCVDAGISISNLYYMSDKPIDLPERCKDIFQGFRQVNPKELTEIGFQPSLKYAVSFISPTVEPRYYLKYLSNNFQNNGGKIINETVSNGKKNVADWALKKNYDIIVNCSGLGARDLFEDHQMMPIRGQIVRVRAPWLKFSFVTTNDSYAMSCRESVVLGGFRQKGDWDLSVRPEETKSILERIRNFNICLSESEIVEEWAGLRPWRPNLRLEIEYIKSSDGVSVPVIHNYGHGSSGVGLSWGTSLEAVDLIGEIKFNHLQGKL